MIRPTQAELPTARCTIKEHCMISALLDTALRGLDPSHIAKQVRRLFDASEQVRRIEIRNAHVREVNP